MRSCMVCFARGDAELTDKHHVSSLFWTLWNAKVD